MGFLDGTNTKPVDPVAAAAWDKQDSQLISLLVSSLSEDLVPIILVKETSVDCWKTILEAYGSASPVRLMALQVELRSLRQKPDEDVTTLLRRAKAIADELAASGNQMSTMDFNIYVLRALGDELQDVACSILMKDPPPSFIDLQGLLCSYESMRAFKKLSIIDVGTPANPSANLTQRSGENSKSRHPNNSGDSPAPPEFSTQKYRGGRGNKQGRGRGRYAGRGNLWCSFCNWTNHSSAYCYYRPQSIPRQPAAYYTQQSHQEPLLPTPSPSSAITWFPDTGASHHVTPDQQSMSSYDEYTGYDQVRVGNGKGLKISHIGNGTLFSSKSPSFKLSNVLHVPSNFQKFTFHTKIC